METKDNYVLLLSKQTNLHKKRYCVCYHSKSKNGNWHMPVLKITPRYHEVLRAAGAFPHTRSIQATIESAFARMGIDREAAETAEGWETCEEVEEETKDDTHPDRSEAVLEKLLDRY